VAKGDNNNSLGRTAITPVDLRLCHQAHVLPSASGSELGSRSAISLRLCH